MQRATLPRPDYFQMEGQITQCVSRPSMRRCLCLMLCSSGARRTLVDWLMEAHAYYSMQPESLWMAINLVDRLLSKKIASISRLQLLGVTALFIAAKCEETTARPLNNFVFDFGCSREDILKAERFVLHTLYFYVSSACSPFLGARRISKAGDNDHETRTMSKFVMEVTLLDHRFLGTRPSQIAALGAYSARHILGSGWNDAFVHHSGFSVGELEAGHLRVVRALRKPDFAALFLYKKYASVALLGASVIACDWALSQPAPPDDT